MYAKLSVPVLGRAVSSPYDVKPGNSGRHDSGCSRLRPACEARYILSPSLSSRPHAAMSHSNRRRTDGTATVLIIMLSAAQLSGQCAVTVATLPIAATCAVRTLIWYFVPYISMKAENEKKQTIVITTTVLLSQ